MKRRLSPLAVMAVAGVAALLLLLAYGLAASEPDRELDEALARGELVRAPELTLPRLSGTGSESLADYRGKVVVLNVWASWCDPCRAESPLLQRWHERISADGEGTVLGVDVLDVTGDARAFVREYGLTYPQLRDPDGDSLEALEVVGYPETFVIDRAGRVAASARGPVDDAWMREHVAPLVASVDQAPDGAAGAADAEGS